MTASLRMEIFPADRLASVAFYVEVLRFEAPESGQEDYTSLRRGTVTIGVSPRPDDVDPAGRRPPTGVEIVLEVDDLDAEWDHVRATGWPVDEGLTARPWGLRDFRVLDPDGYYWRVTELG